MRIGLVTFHASHNHGSMLQAFATQQTITKLGHDCDIINFQMQSQKDYYALYQTKYGLMRFLRGITLVPVHLRRVKREKKYNDFMVHRMKLTEKEYNERNELIELSSYYDCYVAGSDQIWCHSVPELIWAKKDYTGVYFLDFVSDNRKRVSYASSIGDSQEKNLEDKKELLEKFSWLSTREKSGADILEKVVNKPISVVLDPTLLMNKQEWMSCFEIQPIVSEEYILLYTLRGIRSGREWVRRLKPIAKQMKCAIVVVSPFYPIVDLGIRNLINVGPEDFLNLIYNAKAVFTDSFHGTAFSINFEKPFYSLTLENKRDIRKTDLMTRLGVESRIITSFSDLDVIKEIEMDYSDIKKMVEKQRKHSNDFLQNALSE